MTGPADGEQGGLEQVSSADRIPALTGLRAVAALSVMGTHAGYGTGALNDGYHGSLLAHLDIGVAVFFVLSGMLLFGPWVRSAAVGVPGPSVRRYSRSRIRRIMPAYLITVLLAYLVYEIRPIEPNPGHTWTGLIRNLTLTQIYGDYFSRYQHQGLTQMWSLAVEVSFYLMLPLLAWLLVRTGRHPWRLLVGVAMLAAISPLWLLALRTTDWLPAGAGLWLPHYLAWFAGGMVLAVLQTTGARFRWAIAAPLVVGGYLLVATPLVEDEIARTLLYGVIATVAVAPAALGAPGGLLSHPAIVRMGEVSYEIFLLHVIVMEVAFTAVLRWPLFTGSAGILFGVTLVMTLPCAWLLHRVTRPR